MTHTIITKPGVHVVASSMLNDAGLTAFAEEQGLAHVHMNSETPLGKIMAIAEGFDEGFTDAEVIPEFGGRFCYGSWEKGRGTAEYVQNILEMEHGSVLEHSHVSLALTGVSRSLSLELARHRPFNISQESQRYVDASNINFVLPPIMNFFAGGNLLSEEIQDWFRDQRNALDNYVKWQEFLELEIKSAIADGRTHVDEDILLAAEASGLSREQIFAKQFTRIQKRANEAARSLLPNACETKLLWTGNLRGLRHVIMLRGSDPADLEIRQLAVEVAKVAKTIAPTVFADIEIVPGSFGVDRVVGKFHKV